jgi:hypothetical protein
MDEWGIYDPSQAGIEAVLRRIAPTAPDDSGQPTK